VVHGIALFQLEKEEAGPSAPLKNASLRMIPLGVLRKKSKQPWRFEPSTAVLL
jgi:hypothetical protein